MVFSLAAYSMNAFLGIFCETRMSSCPEVDAGLSICSIELIPSEQEHQRQEEQKSWIREPKRR